MAKTGESSVYVLKGWLNPSEQCLLPRNFSLRGALREIPREFQVGLGLGAGEGLGFRFSRRVRVYICFELTHCETRRG